MTPLVSIRDVSKSFAGVRALSNVGFDLLPGEVHALMGENGAGKSTLMKILSGVHRPDSGAIEIDGRPVQIDSPAKAQSLGIGIVHQELNLMNHLDAAQNIFIGREPRSAWGMCLDERALHRQAQAIFDRLNLKLDPRSCVGELTVAKQQMIEIAKALSFESKVLIMDEPTAALNQEEVADLFRVVRQLRSEGVGIVYISHKMDELQQIADRVTVMRDGQHIETLPLAETSTDEIISLMVGRKLEHGAEAKPDASGNEVLLQVSGLCRGAAVRDVGFSLRRGEILGFAGLMGAGRTEVARAIFGADAMARGEIRVKGQPVKIRSPRHAVRLGIGYLSEDRKHFGLATGLDVETNIAMSSMDRFTTAGFFVNHGKLRHAAKRYVRELSIKTPSVEQQVRLLSGGNQQKIVIAKWLLRDCDILFFDEPTRGIDIGAKAEIYRLLNELAEEGKAIVLISSELPEVLRLSHRILVMCEGRITGELSATEASQEAIMRLATQRDSA